jgi:hypothetical protein
MAMVDSPPIGQFVDISNHQAGLSNTTRLTWPCVGTIHQKLFFNVVPDIVLEIQLFEVVSLPLVV